MGSNIEAALKAKETAEKLFVAKDFAGAKNKVLKAQTLCPELDGISQMVATFDIYASSERKINEEIDFYTILGLPPYADKSTLKKQYKKMAVILHPDKNKTVGADGAFKLVSEAWSVLSDSLKRSSYDIRRNKHLASGVVHTNLSSSFDNCSKPLSSHNRLDTFWTACTSCHVQYEYLRKYVNKKLSCKNCRGIFIAVETGVGPVTGSFPYGVFGATYIPTTAASFTGNGVSGFHSVHGSEYPAKVSFQGGSNPGVVGPTGLSSKSVNGVHHANGNVTKANTNGRHHMRNGVVDMGSNGYVLNGPRVSRVGRPRKRMKVDVGPTSQNITKSGHKIVSGSENIINNPKVVTPSETTIKRYSAAPAFDARKLLIDKARTVIRKKLEEVKLALASVVNEVPKVTHLNGVNGESEPLKTKSVPITVPDSDFHDFDKDRAEECFKPKQIWALYDEEDGMPRLYCLIRQVVSINPFKIHISHLSSKTDTEFGSVNWVYSGFTKSCGNFRAFNSEVVDQVNIFSHHLSREKAGRGGCVRIYPKSGDIWAVYRNWSPNWNSKTPDEVRHQYEMVEVLDDYSEELGVCVAPLIKVEGFKTVYRRNTKKEEVRWIPRREMLRFSHRVPACLLNGEGGDLPDGCWDLDPAATPDEFLQDGSC